MVSVAKWMAVVCAGTVNRRRNGFRRKRAFWQALWFCLFSYCNCSINERQNNKLHLIVLASDASASTKDKVTRKAYFYNVPVLDIYDVLKISQATGIKNPVVSGIDDAGLAKAILDSKEANNWKKVDQWKSKI